MRKWLPILLITSAAAYFLNQFNIFKTGLSARLGIIKFNAKETRESGFFRLVIDVQLIIKNPSRIQGKITGGKVDAFLGDKLIASITQFGNIAINAGSDSALMIKLALPTLSLVNSVVELIKNIGTGYAQTINIKGVINTNLGDLNISEKINFTI